VKKWILIIASVGTQTLQRFVQSLFELGLLGSALSNAYKPNPFEVCCLSWWNLSSFCPLLCLSIFFWGK
jgi:hypothetical protein